MLTFLDTCLKEIEIHEYLKRVLGGLDDEEEVKKLCYLMLVKLAHIAPTTVAQRAYIFLGVRSRLLELTFSFFPSLTHASNRSRRLGQSFYRNITNDAQGECGQTRDRTFGRTSEGRLTLHGRFESIGFSL